MRVTRDAARDAGREIVKTEVTGLSHEGAGVGRHGERVVFVRGAIPGDVVTARVVDRRKSFSRAELLRVDRPSSLRVPARCPVAGDCGGCSLQEMSYEGQLEWKRRQVEDALARIGHLRGVVVRDTVPSPERWGYRNKMMFPVGRAGGRLVAGCFRKGTHDIVPAASCLIQHPINNLILREALKACEAHGVEPYDESTGRGLLRHIMGRVAAGTGESMAVLVTAVRRFPQAAAIAEELQASVPGLVG